MSPVLEIIIVRHHPSQTYILNHFDVKTNKLNVVPTKFHDVCNQNPRLENITMVADLVSVTMYRNVSTYIPLVKANTRHIAKVANDGLSHRISHAGKNDITNISHEHTNILPLESLESDIAILC